MAVFMSPLLTFALFLQKLSFSNQAFRLPPKFSWPLEFRKALTSRRDILVERIPIRKALGGSTEFYTRDKIDTVFTRDLDTVNSLKNYLEQVTRKRAVAFPSGFLAPRISKKGKSVALIFGTVLSKLQELEAGGCGTASGRALGSRVSGAVPLSLPWL